MSQHIPAAAFAIDKPWHERTLCMFDRALWSNRQSATNWLPAAFALLTQGDNLLMVAATLLSSVDNRSDAVLVSGALTAASDAPMECRRSIQRLLVTLWERNHGRVDSP
jgi:hypothetical protein